MTKYVYFSPVNPEDVEPGLFEVEGQDQVFDFKLEINPEDGFVRLYDSIGRMVPLDHTQIEGLVTALSIASEFFIAEVNEVYCLDNNGVLV